MVFPSRQPVDMLLYNSTMRWPGNRLSFHIICLDYGMENNMQMSKFCSTVALMAYSIPDECLDDGFSGFCVSPGGAHEPFSIEGAAPQTFSRLEL